MENQTVFNHRTPIQIRFNDVDMMAHVNNAVYQQYFDYARIQYFNDVFGYLVDWYRAALVLVHIEMDFVKPVSMMDDVYILTRIYHMGNKSLRMEQRLTGNSNEDVRCRCDAVLSGFNAQSKASIILPGEWRNKIRQFESDADLND